MKKEIYRFNLNIPMDLKKYLEDISWKNRTTITAYIISLINSDKEKRNEEKI